MAKTTFVLCINNEGYPASLELRKVYQTLPDPKAVQYGQLRLIDESGDDYLYPATYFVPIAVPDLARPLFAVAA